MVLTKVSPYHVSKSLFYVKPFLLAQASLSDFATWTSCGSELFIENNVKFRGCGRVLAIA
jgi:hypothetical protein